MIRVAVADDQALVRSGFSVLLRSAGDVEVVGEAGNGREAVALVAAEAPDIVLMDIRMPDLDGIEATRCIVGSGAATRILVLTTFDLDEYVFGALQAGASGFLLKDTEPEELLTAVRVVAAGEALLAPRITRRLIERFAEHEAAAEPRRVERPGLDALTEREVEVLAAVARGRSNAEIADELFMAHATAKTHVSRLLTKLDCRDRAQLVMVAYESGIAVPGAAE